MAPTSSLNCPFLWNSLQQPSFTEGASFFTDFCFVASPSPKKVPKLGVTRGLGKKDPCNFNAEMFVPKVGNPCPTLGPLLASRILYALLVAEKQHEIARARFCTQTCSKVGQLLVNSSLTPHPMGSCRVFCSSPQGNKKHKENPQQEFLRESGRFRGPTLCWSDFSQQSTVHKIFGGGGLKYLGGGSQGLGGV